MKAGTFYDTDRPPGDPTLVIPPEPYSDRTTTTGSADGGDVLLREVYRQHANTSSLSVPYPAEAFSTSQLA